MTRLPTTFFSALLMGLFAILSTNILSIEASGDVSAVPVCSDHSRIQCKITPNCTWRKKKCLQAPTQQDCSETTKKRPCKKRGCIWKAKTCHFQNQKLNPRDDNSDFWKSLVGLDATFAEAKIDLAFSDFYRVVVCPNQFTPGMHHQCLIRNLDDRRVRLVVHDDNTVVETPCPG